MPVPAPKLCFMTLGRPINIQPKDARDPQHACINLGSSCSCEWSSCTVLFLTPSAVAYYPGTLSQFTPKDEEPQAFLDPGISGNAWWQRLARRPTYHKQGTHCHIPYAVVTCVLLLCGLHEDSHASPCSAVSGLFRVHSSRGLIKAEQ